jgi:hypothetical protein
MAYTKKHDETSNLLGLTPHRFYILCKGTILIGDLEDTSV